MVPALEEVTLPSKSGPGRKTESVTLAQNWFKNVHKGISKQIVHKGISKQNVHKGISKQNVHKGISEKNVHKRISKQNV